MKRKRTPWFPPGTNPVHVGMYECKTCRCQHYWNGRLWHFTEGGEIIGNVGNVIWRGLTEKPVARATKS